MTEIIIFFSIVAASVVFGSIILFYKDVKEGPKYRIKECKNGYLVQIGFFPFWLTIKSFSDPDKWWAEANAKNLLDELNKEL